MIRTLLLTNFSSSEEESNLTAEQQRLSFIKDRWTIEGSENTYIEICDRIQGNHIECVSTSKEDEAENSKSYFSYSASEKVYIYYGLYGNGTSRTLRGKWIEDKFVFEGVSDRMMKS